MGATYSYKWCEYFADQASTILWKTSFNFVSAVGAVLSIHWYKQQIKHIDTTIQDWFPAYIYECSIIYAHTYLSEYWAQKGLSRSSMRARLPRPSKTYDYTWDALHVSISSQTIVDNPACTWTPKTKFKLCFQNGACLVGKILAPLVGVFCTHLEPPNCHISPNRFFQVFRDLGPSP